MAFGFTETEGSSNGEFLGRLQFDARVGSWKVVKRVQGADGYSTVEGDPSFSASFAIDFGTLEVGFSKIASPPVFMMVPYGKPLPLQPEEMQTDDKTGKKTKAFKPAFRAKVAGKMFGDNAAYYFSANSKNVMNATDALYNLYLAAPEAAEGKIPVVSSAKSTAIKTSTSSGTSTFYAPGFMIVAWIDRPAVFGERTVPAPSAGRTAQTASAAPPTRHVPAPTAKLPEPAMVDADSDMPF